MLYIGSTNILNLEKLPDRRNLEFLEANDPIRVKQEIRLNEVSEKLFSTINTGVRYWPFLLVARDHYHIKSEQRIIKDLKRIQRYHQKNYQKKRVGPGTIATFQYYLSMYNRLTECLDKESEELRRFINDKRRKYVGDFEIYRQNNNDKKWKKALVKSMGVAGKRFAKLLDKIADSNISNTRAIDIVEQAITYVLKNKSKFDIWLWRGAFCYAFLRCMYGINDIEGINPHIKASEWADKLFEVLKSPRAKEIPVNLKKYAHLIEKAKKAPPWKNMTMTMQEDNRRVLSNLRFHVFYNLYVRPIPEGY